MKRLFIIFISLLLLCTPCVLAINIGVSPGTMTFQSLVKGGYAEQDVILTTNSESNVTGHIDFGGEISNWIHLTNNESSFTFSRLRPFKSKIVIEPPEDAQAGNYSGQVSFVTDAVSSVTGTTGSAVRASVAVSLSAEVVGEQFIGCTVGAISLPSTESGRRLEFSSSILNTGNVRLRPNIELTVWDQLRQSIIARHSFRSPEILPTTSQNVFESFPSSLEIGQYWLEIVVPDCKTDDILTFSIVSPGEIADSGTLDGIFVKPLYYVGSPAEITAVFSNKGARSVNAQFKGQIYRNNQLVSVLDSDSLTVLPGTQNNFKMFFTAPSEGTYEIRGRVVYNNKLSFERSITFQALSTQNSGFPIFIVFVFLYFVILALIVFLIIVIRKEMRKRRDL